MFRRLRADGEISHAGKERGRESEALWLLLSYGQKLLEYTGVLGKLQFSLLSEVSPSIHPLGGVAIHTFLCVLTRFDTEAF